MVNKKFFTTGGIVSSSPGDTFVSGEPLSLTRLYTKQPFQNNTEVTSWNLSHNGEHTIYKTGNTGRIGSMSPAYDIRTHSGVSSTSLGSNFVRGLGWNYDGTQQLGLSNSGASLRVRNLSTPYGDMSDGYDFNLSATAQGANWIFENSFGGEYFYQGSGTSYRQFNTTNGKLTSTSTYSNTTFPVSGYPTVSADGNYIFIWVTTTGTMKLYSLATAYDITSTKTFVRDLTFSGGGMSSAYNRYIFASRDGNYIYTYYVSSYNGAAHQYQINY